MAEKVRVFQNTFIEKHDHDQWAEVHSQGDRSQVAVFERQRRRRDWAMFGDQDRLLEMVPSSPPALPYSFQPRLS
jgi:hypothetical protein